MAAYEMCGDAADLYGAGKAEEARAIYERVIAEFGDSTDGYLRELVVSSIGYRALIRLGNPEIASRTEPTPDLVARLNRTDDGALRGKLAQAIGYETGVLTTLGRQEQALALSRNLVDALRGDDSPEVRRHAALACQNVVELLRGQGRSAEAEEAARDLAARFGEELLTEYEQAIAENGESDRDTRLGVRFRRADLLRAMGRTDEAIGAYEDVISEFGDDLEVEVVVDRAREWRAALIARGEGPHASA
jgi:tetratricopeptide (TPR) repeat protein